MKRFGFLSRLWALLVIFGSSALSAGELEAVVPGPGPVKSVWGPLRPEVVQVLSAVLNEHRLVTSEPLLFRVGTVAQGKADRVGAEVLRALEAAKVGGARRNGVVLWMVPGLDAQAGAALGFAVDSVWPADEREAWVQKRVMPALRRGKLEQAAGAWVWGALEGLQSPIIQKNDVRSRLEKVGALALEELPEDGGLDRGLGLSGWILALILAAVVGLLFWIFAVASGGEREFDGARWRRVDLASDLWGRFRLVAERVLERLRPQGRNSREAPLRAKSGRSGFAPPKLGDALDLPACWLAFESQTSVRLCLRKTQSHWDRDLTARCESILRQDRSGQWDAVLLVHPGRQEMGWAEREGDASHSAFLREQFSFLESALRETQFETALAVFLKRGVA